MVAACDDEACRKGVGIRFWPSELDESAQGSFNATNKPTSNLTDEDRERLFLSAHDSDGIKWGQQVVGVRINARWLRVLRSRMDPRPVNWVLPILLGYDTSVLEDVPIVCQAVRFN